MRRLIPAVVMLSLFVAGAGAAAQSSDTIPKELVTLLLRGPGVYPGENFDIKIGAPANFPMDLLPKGVTPAVSTTSERVTMVVAEAPALTSRQMLQHERDLVAAGWVSMSMMSMSGRGLVSNNSSMPSVSACKGDQYATIYSSPRPAGGLYLRVSLTTDPRRGSCVASPARPLSGFADVDLPALLPPDGVPTVGSGASNSGDSFTQHLRMQTTMALDDIVEHYASQLEKAGWKRERKADTQGFAIARLSTVSTGKETVLALITAVTMPDGKQVDVGLQMLRVDPNRRFPGMPGGRGGNIGATVVIPGVCCN